MTDVHNGLMRDETLHVEIELKNADERNSVEKVGASEKPFYTVEEIPPLGVSILCAIQQALLCIDGLIAVPWFLFTVLCFDDSPDANEAKPKIIASYFFLAGLISFLQTTFGIRLPTAQIVTSAYLVPLISVMRSDKWKCPARITNFTEHNISFSSNTSYLYLDNDSKYIDSSETWQRRMREVQGGIILAGVAQMIIGTTGVIGVLLRFIGPLTIAPPLLITAILILDLTVYQASIHWGISLSVMAVAMLCQYLANIQVPLPYYSFKSRRMKAKKMPLFAMFPFILALLFGWLLAHILTITDILPADKQHRSYYARTDSMPEIVSRSPWISIPYPIQWGWPTISVPTIVAFLASLLIGIIDSLCDYYACGKVVGHSSIPNHAINRGLFVEGFGILLHGLIGSGNATTTFARNIVGLEISKVYSRRVVQYMCGIYILLGLVTKFCSVFAAIPAPVLAGQLFIVSGYVFSLGITTANNADISNMRNMFVLGCSTFLGLMFQDWIAKNPNAIDVGSVEANEIIKVILGTGLLVSPVVACILDNTLPGSMKIRGMTEWHKGQRVLAQVKEDHSVFDLPFKTNWKWTRWIPICPMFGAKPQSKAADNA